MTSILIVDDDKEFSSAVGRMLRGESFEVRTAHGYDSAMEALRQKAPDILLVDLRLRGKDGLVLIEEAKKLHPAVTPILMSAYATARDYQRATDLGAVAVLSKPFAPKELTEALEKAVEWSGGFRGSLHGLSLIDMLQMFHLARRSVVVLIGAEPAATLHFEDGEIVHAAQGDQVGVEALRAVLGTKSGSIRTTRYMGGPHTIDRSFQSLVLDTLRVVDEISRDLDPSLELDFGEAEETVVAMPHEAPRPAWSDLIEAATEKETRLPEIEVSEPTVDVPLDVPVLAPERPLDPLCRAVTAELRDGLGCAFVVLSTGELLGFHSLADFPSEFEALLADVVRGAFCGPAVVQIEAVLQGLRGMGAEGRYVEELQLGSRHTLHLAKVIKDGQVAVVVVTRKVPLVDPLWAQLRGMVKMLEGMIP